MISIAVHWSGSGGWQKGIDQVHGSFGRCECPICGGPVGEMYGAFVHVSPLDIRKCEAWRSPVEDVQPCPVCNGSGEVLAIVGGPVVERCRECGGGGLVVVVDYERRHIEGEDPYQGVAREAA